MQPGSGACIFAYTQWLSTIIGVTARMVLLPSSNHIIDGSSAYVSSKMAQVRLFEYLAAENLDVFVVAVHPGVIEAPLMESMKARAESGHMTLDDGDLALYSKIRQAMETSYSCDIAASLPAHFLVWVASLEARFLNGKFIFAN